VWLGKTLEEREREERMRLVD